MTPSPPESYPLAGTVLAERYEVLHPIGDGGMGTVYRARQRALRRDVAIKALRPDLPHAEAKAEYRARFEEEAATSARLCHPNTVRVHDYGCHEGTYYLVMEFIEGESVRSLVRRGGLSPLRALHVIRQVCGALREVHALGLVHRDVKPDNVMVSPRPEDPYFVKVIDLGLAGTPSRAEADRADRAEPGPIDVSRVGGTPHFVSPEQIQGHAVDARADVYGVGATLLFMLTGAAPFGEHLTSEVEVLEAQLTTDPPALSGHAALPGPLVALVRRCMARCPEDRFGGMSELLDALTACEAALEGSPHPTPPPPPASPPPPARLPTHAATRRVS